MTTRALMPSESPDPTVRLMAYANLVQRLQDEIAKDQNLAPVIIAYIRGLRAFPEYRDTTVMYLDTITVDGHSLFDQLMKQEITGLLDVLLGSENG